MQTHLSVTELAQQVDALDLLATTAWLKSALSGRAPLPLLTPDEFPYLGVTRIEPHLDKATRRDLETACRTLVRDALGSSQVDSEYLFSLLRLVVCWTLDDVAPALMAKARELASAKETERCPLLLMAILDLKIAQPESFWREMLHASAVDYAGLAVQGLLLGRWPAAIEVLPQLPNMQRLADAVTIVVGQRADSLAATDRAEFCRAVRRVVPSCPSLLADNLREWLDGVGAFSSNRELDRLRAALKIAVPGSSQSPACSRLVPPSNLAA